MRTRALTWLAALATLAAVASGCSGDDSPSGGTGGAASGSLPSQAELSRYFTAVAGYDVTALGTVADDVAAAGSPAAAYARYQAEIAQAATAAGQDPGGFEATATDGGFEACGADGATCATWADLKGEDGRLTDFTVNQVDLSDSLVDLTGQAPVDVDGLLTVQPEYAYRSPIQQTLFVTVQLTAAEVALQPQPARAVYIEGQDVLSGASTSAAGSIAAGASGYVTLEFADADKAALDGQVTFPVKVGGASAQSVGFGLTAQ